MRKLGALVVVIALGLAACASDHHYTRDDYAAPPRTTRVTVIRPELKETASTVTDLLIAAKWDDVVATFDARMRKSLSRSRLKTAWSQLTDEYGPYKSRSATEISLTAQAPPDISVFDTPVTFGSTELKTRISLDEYGEVAGLFILTADAL